MRRNCCIIGVWVVAALPVDFIDDTVSKIDILGLEIFPSTGNA